MGNLSWPQTANHTNVPASVTSVTVLAANENRKGATVFNDSPYACYLSLSGDASPTNFIVRLDKDGYWEVPYLYCGAIKGIWTSAASGAARVTELL